MQGIRIRINQKYFKLVKRNKNIHTQKAVLKTFVKLGLIRHIVLYSGESRGASESEHYDAES